MIIKSAAVKGKGMIPKPLCAAAGKTFDEFFRD